jgi:hypothetical protein
MQKKIYIHNHIHHGHGKIVVHFRNQKDIDKFAKLIGQKITKAPSLWYPKWKKRRYADKQYIDES